MTPVTRLAERTGQCRMCNAYCDKVVDPSACIAASCPFLYAYDDELSGKRYIGCLNKVFKAEIDAAELEAARRTRRSFGAIRATGQALPFCPTSIEPAFSGFGAGYDCVNPSFWDAEEHDAAGLDLREWI